MASTTDKITDTRYNGRPSSTTASGTRDVGGTYLECVSLTGWSTRSKVHFVTYKIDTNNKQIPNTQQDCSGIVSGNALTQIVVIDGGDKGNELGDVVEMLPTAAWGQDLADALIEEHDRTGKHTDVTAESITVLGDVDITGTITVNGINLAAIMYPVGAIYTELTGVNPGTTFGFGTWSRFGSGRVPVGVDTSNTNFNTVEKTGGVESVTLTSAQSGLPAHNHSAWTDSQGSHHHYSVDPANGQTVYTNGGSNNSTQYPVTGTRITWGNSFTSYAGDHGHNVGTGNNPAADAASAHSNLQPFITVYMWKRTA